jgi:CRISPR system Cascade subunit CasB
MTSYATRERTFVDRLVALAATQDRAALAALRRGVGRSPGEPVEAARAFYRLLPGEVGYAEDDFWLVATLFSLHPSTAAEPEGRKPSLAASLARLARTDASKSNGAERMTMVLLRADRDELPHHLRRAVLLLRSAGVPVAWEQLLHDLRWWSAPSSRVRQRWARDYWAMHEESPNDPVEE